MSASSVQGRLRVTMIILSTLTIFAMAAFYIAARSIDDTLRIYNWLDILRIVVPIVVLLVYVVSLRSSARIHRAARAIPLLVICGLWLFIECKIVNSFVRLGISLSCGGADRFFSICILSRMWLVFSLFAAVFFFFEIVVTLYVGPMAKVPKQSQEVIIVSPLSVQPQNQQQQQQQHYSFMAPQPGYDPNMSYPQQHQQQPYPQYPLQQLPYQNQQEPQQLLPILGQYTPQQGYMYPQQPYQSYQPYQQQQQQQQQQEQQRLYTPAPGTTVTATPQPGGQPLVPYPSPGTSVAVSPVLPVTGSPAVVEGGSGGPFAPAAH
ncbi:hypothetical protein BG004_004040 [Podila humilis]|nr:hypothetical protein BG004_004040 [Podila humilis]